jgi:co-chaperonin GroES (HSP10)
MKAVNHYIIVDKIKEEPKKVNGLIMTESLNTDIRYLRGKIISVGNNTEALKEGDSIYYDKHAGHGIEWDGKMYYVIKQQDVVIVE